jgi:hypothetical protein
MSIWESVKEKEEKDLYERKMRVIEILNTLIKLCQPFTYDEFNKKIDAIDSDKLFEYEKQNIEAGLVCIKKDGEDPKKDLYGISTLSLIASITDILVGDRLAFQISDDEKEAPKGTIMGVQWYYESEKKRIETSKEEKKENKKDEK